jgi:hypothetical protein
LSRNLANRLGLSLFTHEQQQQQQSLPALMGRRLQSPVDGVAALEGQHVSVLGQVGANLGSGKERGRKSVDV